VSPVPILLEPQGDGQKTLVDFSTFGHTSLQDAIEDGMGRLQANQNGAAWQAMYYDGFVNLPGGRRDALVVELRVYDRAKSGAAGKSLLGGLFKGKQATEPAKTSLRLTMALPYRPVADPQGFANFSPRLVDCSFQGDQQPVLLDMFYRGIYTAKHFQWEERLVEE
jgi:hypothetical protein